MHRGKGHGLQRQTVYPSRSTRGHPTIFCPQWGRYHLGCEDRYRGREGQEPRERSLDIWGENGRCACDWQSKEYCRKSQILRIRRQSNQPRVDQPGTRLIELFIDSLSDFKTIPTLQLFAQAQKFANRIMKLNNLWTTLRFNEQLANEHVLLIRPDVYALEVLTYDMQEN